MENTVQRVIAQARGWLEPLVGAGLDVLLPMSCQACGATHSTEPLCAACLGEALVDPQGQCPRCGHGFGPYSKIDAKGCSECRGVSLGFDGVVALGWYSGDLGGLCLELKRKPGAWLGEWLGYWLARYRRDRILGLGVEVVVPVPLHWWRRWRRGHNQAERIAWGLARELKLPLRPALRRVRSVEKLASLSRTERLEAMKGAFSVVSENRVRGRTILLVDDVLTSGATCGAAARALKAAGAKRVVAAVVARTDRERA